MPPLTPQFGENDIRNDFDDGAWSRGRGYARYGHIINGRVEGDTLYADCIGSQPYPYHVRATWRNRRLSAHCTCPIGVVGDCKHVVALLLTWIEHPEDFVLSDMLDDMIAGATADQLREAIEAVIEDNPQAAKLVEQVLQGPAHWSAEQVRREVDRAMSDWEPDEDDAYEEWQSVMPRQVILWITRAKTSMNDGQFRAVVELTGGLLAGLRPHLHPYASIVGDCLQHVITLIAAMLGTSVDVAPRRRLIELLLDLHDWHDSEIERYLGDLAGNALIAGLTDQERAPVAEMIMEKRYAPRFGKWMPPFFRRQALLYYALIDADSLAPSDRLFKAEMLSDPIMGMDMLLELDREDEALALLRFATENDVDDYLAPFERRNRVDTALDWMIAHEIGMAGYSPWLRETLAGHDRWDTLIALARSHVYETPFGQAYIKDLRKAAAAIGCWDQERAKVVAHFGENNAWSTVVSIYVDDEMWDEALEAMDRVTEETTAGSLMDYRAGVADRVGRIEPMAAALILAEDVEVLIGKRGRTAYRQAAQRLERIRNYHDQAGMLDRWQDYIDVLMWDYGRLSALIDELHKAGL